MPTNAIAQGPVRSILWTWISGSPEILKLVVPGVIPGRFRHQTEAPISSLSYWFYLVTPAGLEPATAGLEIRCSIQLSYGVT
jgi:hypothetical protein